MPDDPTSVSVRADRQYVVYTGKSSDIARTLALAGLGIVWLFGGGLTPELADARPQDVVSALRAESSLYIAALGAIVALALDLAQYALSAIRWGLLHWALDQVQLNDSATVLARRGQAAWAILRSLGYRNKLVKDRRTREIFRTVSGAPWENQRNRFRQVLRKDSADEANRAAMQSVLTDWQPASITRPALWLWVAKLVAVSTTYVALLIYFL